MTLSKHESLAKSKILARDDNKINISRNTELTMATVSMAALPSWVEDQKKNLVRGFS